MDIKGFKAFNLSGDIMKSLELLNYTTPTRVQSEVIPAIMEGKDLIVKSQTGSGKTAAFAIPLCEQVDWEENAPQALVVTPTRELAMQVKDEIFNIGRFKRIKACAVFGKAPFRVQERELKQKTHIVVGTPGRLIDHIEQKTLDTSQIRYLVIDEADEMLNMGFIDQLNQIIETLPKKRTTLLFSATVPSDIENLCAACMQTPGHIEIQSQNHAFDRIVQMRYDVDERDKFDLLRDITVVENPDSCMIFCNMKMTVDDVYQRLKDEGYTCSRIHGGMAQRDRMRELDGFKRGKVHYLVATGVAARGIDVDNVSLVINYDIPEDPESYVHRIGRTARRGLEGRAATFVSQGDDEFLAAIEAYTERTLEICDFPDPEAVSRGLQEHEQKMTRQGAVKADKAEKLNEGIMKLHVNAGKKQKMRAADIVGTLCGIEGMTKDDIGVINIQDISTYFEVLHGKGQTVLKALQSKPLKGRIRKVSKAEDELWPGEKRARRGHDTRQANSGRKHRRPMKIPEVR